MVSDAMVMPQDDPAAWGHARGAADGAENLEDRPTAEEIRWPDLLCFSIRIYPERVEPFEGPPRHIPAWDIASLGE